MSAFIPQSLAHGIGKLSVWAFSHRAAVVIACVHDTHTVRRFSEVVKESNLAWVQKEVWVLVVLHQQLPSLLLHPLLEVLPAYLTNSQCWRLHQS